MKKFVTLLVMVSLVGFGFLLPPREAGAITYNFTNIGTGVVAPPTVTGPPLSFTPWEPDGILDVYAIAYGSTKSGWLSPRVDITPPYSVTYTQGSGLGVLDGTTYPVDGGVTIAGTGLRRYISLALTEGLIFHVPEGYSFESITLNGVGAGERAIVRGLGDNFVLAAITSVAQALSFLSSEDGKFDDLNNLSGDWLLVRAPMFDLNLLDQGSSSFYVANLTIEAPATVPEPSTLILLGCGLIGVGVYRRMFRKS